MLVQPAPSRADPAQAVAPVTPVKPVTRVSLADLLSSAGGDARQRQAFGDLLRSSGTLPARVLETRADGVSVLELLNTRVALRLVSAVTPGELLQLGLEDTTTGTAPTQVKLSGSAMLINDIQKTVLNQIVTKQRAIAPMSENGASPQVLAQALQHAVRSCGLFYESHLRGWIDGRMALVDLFEEPQAQVKDLPQTPGNDAREATRGRAETPVHPQLEPLVRQQLETLERQSIIWHGELWPGQQAELVITGEPQADTTTESPRAWRVQLELDTPGLGHVTADVALSGRTLNLRLQSPDTVAHLLREGRAALADALAAHDLDVNPIHVAGTAP